MRQIAYIILIIALCFIAPSMPMALFSAEISDQSVTIERDVEPNSVVISGTMDVPSYIIAKVIGPKKNYKIVPKVQKLGMWAASKALIAHNQYSFYKVYSTDELFKIAPPDDLRMFDLEPSYLLSAQPDDKTLDMLNKYMLKVGLYEKNVTHIEIVGQHFYRFDIPIKRNMEEGRYRVLLYSFSTDNKLLDQKELNFMVLKTAKWRKFKDLSVSQPTLYAALSILLAILAGLIAGVLRNGAKQH